VKFVRRNLAGFAGFSENSGKYLEIFLKIFRFFRGFVAFCGIFLCSFGKGGKPIFCVSITFILAQTVRDRQPLLLRFPVFCVVL